MVITFGFDPDNPGSNPGKTFFEHRLIFFSSKNSIFGGSTDESLRLSRAAVPPLVETVISHPGAAPDRDP